MDDVMYTSLQQIQLAYDRKTLSLFYKSRGKEICGLWWRYMVSYNLGNIGWSKGLSRGGTIYCMHLC